jgi:hypothetical protein
LTHELYRFSNLEVMGVWERPKPLDINGLAWRLALKQEIDHSSQVLGQAPRLIFRMKLSGPKLLTVFLLPSIEDRLLSQSANRFQVPTSVGRLLLA